MLVRSTELAITTTDAYLTHTDGEGGWHIVCAATHRPLAIPEASRVVDTAASLHRIRACTFFQTPDHTWPKPLLPKPVGTAEADDNHGTKRSGDVQSGSSERVWVDTLGGILTDIVAQSTTAREVFTDIKYLAQRTPNVQRVPCLTDLKRHDG